MEQRAGLDTRPLSDRDIHEAIHGYSTDLIEEEKDLLESTTVLDLKLERSIHQGQRTPNSHNTGLGDILQKLGIDKSTIPSPKKGGNSISGLENAILQDITICANESREILKRRLGYYRYAEQRTYNDMVQRMTEENMSTSNDSEQMDNLFQGISAEIDQLSKDGPGKAGKKR